MAAALTLPLIVLSLTSCHDTPEYPDDPYGNFDALCDIIDTRYCFLDEKGIDWEATCKDYRARIKDDTNVVELFNICAGLLDELKDGHVNLSSRFNTSYYREWWSDYPQDFNLRTLQQYYLEFNYFTTSGLSYRLLGKDVGYIYYPSFSTPVSENNLDYVLALLSGSHGLIIDIRNNGGGLLTNIKTLVGRFISEEIPGGFIRHKTGPGHNDFSEPYPITYKPAEEGRIKWDGDIVILTNRSCFSAANDFVAVMKALPNVKIVGARTGGGGGLPFSSELPNGWSIRFSACPITDPTGADIESGIDPSPGFEIHSSEKELAQGKDAILDFAIDWLEKKWEADHTISAD